ncbi:PAS domain S-box protein [Mucilaginibacter sp. UR6-1]|uniref:PAS domain S-box protein n=1 Tax=Mucilaginibacter sp. UR6-1 TaxID=1435643 RepID=UPI001E3C6F6A|nr:PAS domain S-box protein [Mucilaginibacter sp. UR6-1]MCC8409856.1 PAS domain S-box protein [Mucilaginibacter sp. UR6-1]
MTGTSTPDASFNDDIFRTLIEESPTAVGLYVGPEMLVRLVNDAMLKVWGKSSNVIGKTLHEALPELEGQPFHDLLSNVFNTGIAYEAAEDRVDLVVDGRLQSFYFTFTYKPLKNTDGRVWGILNTATDVTELVLTRKKLNESEQSTRFALYAGELGTWDLDPLNNIITWDERCKELYGFPPDDVTTYNEVLNNIHPDDAGRVNRTVQHALDVNSGAEGKYFCEFRTIGATDKRLRWLQCKGQAYFNNDGIAYRFAGTARDITREVEDNRQQRELSALVESSDDIIYVADLNNKLTYINKAGQHALGLQTTEGMPGTDIFMPEDVERLQNEVLPVLLKKGKWSGNMRYRNVDNGLPIPVHINALRIDDPMTGKTTGLAAVSRDMRPEILANSEKDKLLALVDNSSVFVALSNLDGFVTYVNTYGRQMIGLDSIEDAQRPNTDYVMPGELEKIMAEHRQSMAEKGIWAGTVVYKHFKTGEPIPVEGRTILVYDPITGEPAGRASIARDLRQELADKQALQESQHLLYNITSASPTALWMADQDGNVSYANQTWLDWTGQTYEQVLGGGWINAIVEDDRLAAERDFAGAREKRVPYVSNFRLIRKDGVILWCVAKGNPQYYADGSFAGYIGSCTDITEKTLIDQKLQQTNGELNEQINQFAFVTDFMPVQLWTANLTGDVDYVNRRMVDYFGAAAESISGSRWQNLVHTDDLQNTLDTWQTALNTGEPFQVEFRLRDARGDYKWHLSRALPFYSDGQIIKWFGTNTDIDQHKLLQRQKDDFLGIASHELKTPVTSIKAYAQVLGAMLTKEGEHTKASMVTRMDSQINRLTNLIGDLLDVTKINSGKLQFNKTWFNLNSLVKEVMDDLQHTTVKHTLVENFTHTGKIYADRDRLSQVIVNLISNAIKYSPAECDIIVRTQRTDSEITVSVEDFGIGIAPDKQNRVFEQFYRVSGNIQHTFPGLGLGLYISSEIIKREGGKMWVNSVEGKGSTFHFSLPAQPEN